MPLSPRSSDSPIIAVGYTRVSTKREEMISPELQEHEQDVYAARHGIRIVERVRDLDLSGREFAKRSVDYIVRGIREGRWNTVLLWKWSRWGRNLLQSRLYLAEVEQAGGRVIAVTEDFDTTTSVGRFTRDQMLTIAELQSDQMSESWKETQARRRRNGLPHTGAARFGYLYDRATGYTVDPATAPALKTCYERFVAGTGMRALALELNANGYRTLRGGLFTSTALGRLMDTGFAAGLIRERSNPPNDGTNSRKLSSFDVWRQGAHEHIISMELWETYREKRLANALKAPRLRVVTHTLSGLVVCKACGLTMISARNGERQYHVWRCRKRQETKSCPGAVVSNKRLEAMVREWVTTNAKGGETVEADPQRILAAQKATTDVKACEATISRLKAKRRRLADGYAAGDIEHEDYTALKAEITDQLDAAETALKTACALEAEMGTDLKATFTTLADLWDDATAQERHELLTRVIKRIDIEPGTWNNPNKAVIVPRWA
ncbi:DNA invertase Pin-like site-specific DNA recombinase [Nonomuraea muscovyensis]|uniref:DNA invertase Pin-like site-specific DNA recombinase n=1 Tax=Nonomuraea muscovyensis TaxID=1124761 RepID=A0A7X0F2W5_9ACTN|nr:recombinase family protein [Nonomuraea muscovyensis]MBB6351245.1 DNA invertase Pin-like site-specific DNA recombinase [Nonomuraea muscovyensis]